MYLFRIAWAYVGSINSKSEGSYLGVLIVLKEIQHLTDVIDGKENHGHIHLGLVGLLEWWDNLIIVFLKEKQGF